MDIQKVNESVKLSCQIDNLNKKLDKLMDKLTSEELTEFHKRTI